jgi:uncharacterized lipoprotein YddW (UPF0748 family)
MKRRHALGTLAAAGAGLGTLGAGLGGCAAPGRPHPAPVAGAGGPLPAPAAGAAPPAASATELPPGTQPLPLQEQPGAAPREFRAAWVATVANIDWPSAPGLPVAQQQAQALAILDRAQALKLNALVLQVRPAGDALFPSDLEPWSEFLTGAQGRAPETPWDPLAFWLDGARRRGLELHAWFNPYRMRHSSAKTPLAAPHLALRAPQWVRSYGEQLWADPAEPGAAEHLLAVVADVLRRYDLDGVHIDDYFYPYPITPPGAPPGTPELPFPDDAPYAAYLAARPGGGALALADWRRAQVDSLVHWLYRTVQQVRPGTRVGISPFGLPRPDRRPPGITGFSQYDKLYADVEKWLEEGWLDYLAPQLYWPIDRPGQEFPVLLDAWLAGNPRRRHVWPGLFTSQVVHSQIGQPLGPRAWPAAELLAQVALQRSRGPGSAAPHGGAGGHLHFSMVALMQDRDGVATALAQGPYAEPALVPATPWLAGGAVAPAAPRLRAEGGRWRVEAGGRAAAEAGAAEAGAPAAPHWWALWRRRGGRWQFAVQPAAQREIDVTGADALVVQAVSRLGAEGPRLAVRL